MEQKFKAERPFGVFTNNKGKDIIIYAVGGTFASDAWIRGGSVYSVAGEKFLAITGDDSKEYNVGKRNVRDLKDVDEMKYLLDKAHKCFLPLIEILNIKVRSMHAHIFKTEIITTFATLCEKFSIEEVVEYAKDKIKEYEERENRPNNI